MYAQCQMLKVIILIIRINLFIQKLSISRTEYIVSLYCPFIHLSTQPNVLLLLIYSRYVPHFFSRHCFAAVLTTCVLLCWCCVLLLLWSSLCVVVVVTHCYWQFILSLLTCLLFVNFNCLCQLVCGVQF